MVKGQSPVRRIGLQEVGYDFGFTEAYNLMQVGIFSMASGGADALAAVGPVQVLEQFQEKCERFSVRNRVKTRR
ncbi:hypothetical protein MPLSOD_50016 [Mesorhizobium sp. SOD10]|nr:hypothetical protein MPLSOD_50016 [Mesorhizobium sp. SOD10]